MSVAIYPSLVASICRAGVRSRSRALNQRLEKKIPQEVGGGEGGRPRFIGTNLAPAWPRMTPRIGNAELDLHIAAALAVRIAVATWRIENAPGCVVATVALHPSEDRLGHGNEVREHLDVPACTPVEQHHLIVLGVDLEDRHQPARRATAHAIGACYRSDRPDGVGHLGRQPVREQGAIGHAGGEDSVLVDVELAFQAPDDLPDEADVVDALVSCPGAAIARIPGRKLGKELLHDCGEGRRLRCAFRHRCSRAWTRPQVPRW